MKVVEVKSKYRRIKGSWIATSLLSVLVGLVFTIWPEVVANAANYILGGIILVVGIIYLALSFWSKKGSILTGFGMIFSVILIVIGVFMILKPEFVLSLFPMIVGGIIVIHGLLDLKHSIELATFKYRFWWVALIIAAATIGLGVLLLFNPFSAVTLAFRIIGVILIVDGVSDFWIGFQVKRAMPNEDIEKAKTEILEVLAKEK